MAETSPLACCPVEWARSGPPMPPLSTEPFKYVCQIFGPGSLPEYRLKQLDPQARAVSPQLRAMDNLVQRLKARSGQLQP